MARRDDNGLLLLAGGGVAAWAAWEFLIRPKFEALEASGDSGLVPYQQPIYVGSTANSGAVATPSVGLPSPGAVLSQPDDFEFGDVVGFTSLGPQYSGPLGACIQRKGWPPAKCEERLAQLVRAGTDARVRITALRASNLAATSGQIAEAQAALGVQQSLLTSTVAAYNAAVAAGNAALAARLDAQKIALQNNVGDLQANIAAAAAKRDNSAQLSAWETAYAGHRKDYVALTGMEPPF